MRRLPNLCPFVVFAVQIAAQTVHLVGPNGLPQIRDALAVAAAGDVIHVEPGTYAHFDAAIAVTIRALQPGTVDVVFDPAYAPAGCTFFCALTQGPTLLHPPVGETLHVIGLRFVGNQAPVSTTVARHRVGVAGGRVTLDACELYATDAAALTVTDATLHLQACTMQVASPVTGAPAMLATGSDVTAVDCVFSGGSTLGAGVGFQPGAGIVLMSSRLHAGEIGVAGGSTTFGSFGAPAMVAGTGSTAWLNDATLTAGTGSCAVQNGGATLACRNCTLVDQAGGCPTIAPMPLLGVLRTSPLAAGSQFGVEFYTEPNGFVVIFAAPRLDTIDGGFLLAQPSWLEFTQSFALGVWLADPSGVASASWPIPNSAAIPDQELWLEGLTGLALPLQVSPPVGGIAR